jgi:hypothetical protein
MEKKGIGFKIITGLVIIGLLATVIAPAFSVFVGF